MNRVLAALGFIGTILAANYVTTKYGMLPIGFGLTATAGTYFAGGAFILRDLVQDLAGRVTVAGLIVLGAALSYAVSDSHIATASAVAFLLGEGIDFLVYSPLRKRGYLRAAVASNIIGAAVDTVVFLTVAGFPLSQAFTGQMVGKSVVTLVVVALVVAARRVRRPRPA